LLEQPVAIASTQHASREVKNLPIGQPPSHLGAEEVAAWHEFVQEMEWLRESDRALLELASVLRVQVRKPDCRPRTQTLFRTILCDLGGNPTRRGAVDGDTQGDFFDPDDPVAQYLS
jgi:hypothetical protein